MNEITMDDLPDQAREIANLVGLEDTLRLVSVYGGMPLAFSDDRQDEVGTRRDIIAKLLGKKKAATFFKHFANRIVYIPRCASALKKVRNKLICVDSDKLSVPELVGKYQLTERQIWNILKESADRR